jgi:hypothetical protein
MVAVMVEDSLHAGIVSQFGPHHKRDVGTYDVGTYDVGT